MLPFMWLSDGISFILPDRGSLLYWIIVILLLEMVRELHTFRVRRYHVPIKGRELTAAAKQYRPIRIAFLSDLHNHMYGKNNEKLVRAVRRAGPDLILIGGDMLVGRPGVTFVPAQSLIEQLTRIAPVCCANGNHEQRMKEYPDMYGHAYETYKKALVEAGVVFLENENRRFTVRGREISIAGLELPLSLYEKRNRYDVSKECVSDCLGRAREDCFQILLAHNPVYFPAYRGWGADLTLSGHLHGGVFRVPFWRGFISPQARFFPAFSGEMSQQNGKYIIVSRGLGTHTVNMRLFNQAELVIIDLD